MPKRPEPIPPLPLSGSGSGRQYVRPPTTPPGRVLPPGTSTQYSDTQVLLEELLAIATSIAPLRMSIADKMELLESALFKAAYNSLMSKFDAYMRDKHHGLDPTKTSPAQAGMDAGRRGSQGHGLNTVGGYPTTAAPPGYFPDWSPGGMDDSMGPRSTVDPKKQQESEKREKELEEVRSEIKENTRAFFATWFKLMAAKTPSDVNALTNKLSEIGNQGEVLYEKRDGLKKRLGYINEALESMKMKPDNVTIDKNTFGIFRWILLWLLSPISFRDVLEYVEQTADQSWRKDPTPIDDLSNPGPLPGTDTSPKLWSEAKSSPMSGVPPVIVQRYITDPPKGSDDIPRGIQGPKPTPAPFIITRGVK